MQFIVHMKLESDAIFGNGVNVPGGEDISVQTDAWGFPYLKGSTFKGIFREEFINYLAWEGKSDAEAEEMVRTFLGDSRLDILINPRKLVFSDLCLHPKVISEIQKEKLIPQEVMEMLTYLRTFTSLEGGVAREGSLRVARCIKKGLNFYGRCTCYEKDELMIKEVLQMIKWAGSMRSRGFGKVRICGEEV